MNDWQKLRLEVLTRDDYTCQQCYEPLPKNKLDVHHIFPYGGFNPTGRFQAINNLITLCKSCHKMVEPRHRSIIGASTSIVITKKLVRYLKSQGLMQETYEDVIWRLIGKK